MAETYKQTYIHTFDPLVNRFPPNLFQTIEDIWLLTSVLWIDRQYHNALLIFKIKWKPLKNYCDPGAVTFGLHVLWKSNSDQAEDMDLPGPKPMGVAVVERPPQEAMCRRFCSRVGFCWIWMSTFGRFGGKMMHRIMDLLALGNIF